MARGTSPSEYHESLLIIFILQPVFWPDLLMHLSKLVYLIGAVGRLPDVTEY